MCCNEEEGLFRFKGQGPNGQRREVPVGASRETPLKDAQRHLAVCPLHHSTAYGFVNLALALGNTVVLSH